VVPDASQESITVGMVLDGPEAGCAILGYIVSKAGTSDAVANISGDGRVSANDELLARYKLLVSPAEITTQGVLRTINGVAAKNGNLVLTAGAGVELITSPETGAVAVNALSVSLPEKCM